MITTFNTSPPNTEYTLAPETGGIYLQRVHSPIGRLELLSNGEAVTSLTIEQDGMLPRDDLEENPHSLLELADRQLAEYFAGTRRTFELPLAPHGTMFQRAIWNQLSAIPWGQARTYGSLGVESGRPTAGRAVGGAVGANPLPLFIPCHRVLAADGRITGYSAGNGVPTKIWLLEHEGVVHKLG